MKDLKDTFEFELSKPLQNIHSKEKTDGTFITCEKLHLNCTNYRHSVVEIELEQIFLDAQLTLAGKTERLIKPEDQKDTSKKVATDKENEDIVKLAYLAGGVSIPKLFELFKKLFCGNNPVCFVDQSQTPLSKDDFEKLATKDKKNLIIKYTAVFFIKDWL